MVTERVEIRVVDNGYIVIWDEEDAGERVSYENVYTTLGELRAKLVELFA